MAHPGAGRLGAAGLILAGLVVLPAFVDAARLSDAQRRGKRIYLEGTGRAEITAYLPGPQLDAPATAVTCVGCHMRDGAGQREGGVESADIRYAVLSKDLPGIRLSGRAHPPYDADGLAQAVLAGFDPAGQALHEAHPHYDMGAEDLEDLLAYLQILGDEATPGVSDTEIRIGILVPERGPLAEAGQEIRALLAGYFANVNARGGLFRRVLSLVPIPFDPAIPGAAAAAARRTVEAEEVFCLLANLGVPPDAEASELLAAAEVPVIAPLGIATAGGYGADPVTFHIYASIGDQARVMVDFLAEAPPAPATRVALVHVQDPSGESGAGGVREQLDKHAIPLVETVTFAPGELRAVDTVERLQAARTDAILFFGSGPDARALLGEAGRRGWRPLMVAPATMVGNLPLSLPREAAASVYLAAPMERPDPVSREMAEFVQLIRQYGVPGGHRMLQITAYAGARLLEEGLRRAGRAVSRNRLVEALGSLWEFPTGVTPPLSYHNNRRVGAIGAAIIQADPAKRRLVVAAPWREPK